MAVYCAIRTDISMTTNPLVPYGGWAPMHEFTHVCVHVVMDAAGFVSPEWMIDVLFRVCETV